MSLDGQVRHAVHQVAERVVVPEVDLDSVRSRARRQRRLTTSAALVAAVVAIVVVGTVVGTAVVGDRDISGPEPADHGGAPGLVVGNVPVWYDATGLHRGDVVEQTAVELFSDNWRIGALALVRGGALYNDPATFDVWFHPWGGDPRVVGHSSTGGPGGDPESHVAAWFEGEVLVVYDTLTGRELSRTEGALVNDWASRDHYPSGNGFLHVTADEVLWRSGETVHRLEVDSGSSSVVPRQHPQQGPTLADANGTTRVWGEWTEDPDSALVIAEEGQAPLRTEGLEPGGRLSPDGSFLLAPGGGSGSYGASIVDLGRGDVWQVPGDDYFAWIAWSYGHVAVVQIGVDGEESTLVACDAAARACEELQTEGNVVLPTS